MPPGTAGQSQVDVSLWGMSQQQSWRQRCPVCRVVHSPWEARSGYQSYSCDILTVSTSIMRGLGHIVRGRWGLEITVAARVVHTFQDGFGALDWEKMVALC